MLQCGFYEREITPPIGDYIPGYSGPRNSTTIQSRLYAKSACIFAGADRIESNIILIALDLIFVPATIYDIATKKIEALTGIPAKNVMIAATHTHTGGPIHGNTEFSKADDAWMQITGQSVADCAIMAFRSKQPVTAKFAEGKVENQAYCRDYVMKDGNIRTNPGFHNPDIVKVFGKEDPAFPALFFYNEEGKPIGALTNYACHHDCKAGTEISSDYSGVLAAEMKKTYGPDFVNILFPGACGNINHCGPLRPEKRKKKAFIEVGEALAEEEKRLMDCAEDFEIQEVDACKYILPVPRREVTPERLEEAHWMLENVPTDFYQLNIANPEQVMFKRCKAESIIAHAAKPKNLPFMVQVVHLGELTIYGLNAEIYTEFGLYIKEHSQTKYNFVSTVTNKGVNGYVPVAEAFGTTIYPAQLPSAPLIPEAGQMIADFALEIAKEKTFLA